MKKSGKARDLVLRPRPENVTLTQWLYEELRRAILDGRLARGATVPPTRTLALQHGVSRRIVVNVFDQLRDEGYLSARVGAGTRVSESVPEDYLALTASRVRIARPALAATGEPDPFYRRPVRPFRPIEPALSEFPMADWARLAGRAMRGVSTAVLAGGDAAGYLPLREAIAAYLGSSRGVACTAAQVIVTSGTQQSLDVLSRVLLRRGDRVWMEDPGYSGAADIFRSAEAKIIAVPVDEHGLDPEIGRAREPRPRAVYVTPAHQFPTAVPLRLDRKLDLLRWSRQNQVVVLEDDYDSEFRFAGRPVPAMKGLAGSEHVFLLGTFNKSLFPALRLGYMVVPDAWREPVLVLRRLIERYPPGLSQVVLAEFIEGGHFARHLRRMRELYGARLESLRHCVERKLKGAVELAEIQAGLNTPAYLRNGMSSRGAAERAWKRGLETMPLDQFAIARPDPKGLLLGFAAFDEREIRAGVEELARALEGKA